MPSWSGISREITEEPKEGTGSPFDRVRRRYLANLHAHTRRNVIAYASGWSQDENAPPSVTSITDGDVQGFMEVMQGLRSERGLDLIVHSPGGDLNAAEAVVEYIRQKFTDVRVIVPNLAMSAATAIACSANAIVMGKHSFLGPVDPQIIVKTPLGVRMVAAQAVLDQFEWAAEDCRDKERLAAWMPMLGQYGPDLLAHCQNASELAENLVAGWLKKFMFAGEPKARERGKRIAKWLAEHKNWNSHGRHINRDRLIEKGLVIAKLEDDETYQDLVLSAFHAFTHTFANTSARKIIENHEGRAYIQAVAMMQLPVALAQPKPARAAPPPGN